MEAVPITLRAANAFVKEHHRHSLPAAGCRFAIGCEADGKLVGVAIAGRPVARRLDDGHTLEITRVCSTGERNVNSFLYARVARIAKMMGYRRVITYSLEAECGSSLKAVGARITGEVKPQEWSVPSRPRKSQEVYKEAKARWEL